MNVFTDEKAHELGKGYAIAFTVSGDGVRLATIFKLEDPRVHITFTDSGLAVDSFGITPETIQELLMVNMEFVYEKFPVRKHIATYYCYGGIKLYAQADICGSTVAYFEGENGQYCTFDAVTGELLTDSFANPFVCETLKHEVNLRKATLVRNRPRHMIEEVCNL